MSHTEFASLRTLWALQKRIAVHPGFYALPIGLSLVTASLEGISLGLLVPLLNGFLTKDFSFLKSTVGLSTVLSYLPASVRDSDKQLFVFLLAVFFAVIVLKNILRYASTVSMMFVVFRSHHHLRKTLFVRYLRFGKMFFDTTSIGHHGALFSDFLYAAMRPLITIDGFINAIFSLVIYLVVMSFISWKLTLVAVPLFFVLHFVIRLLTARMQRLSRSLARSVRDLSKKSIDILSTIPLVKASNAEESERRQYVGLSEAKAKLDLRVTMIEQLMRPFQEVTALVAMLTLFAIMMYLLVQDSAAAATSFIVYFYLIFNAANKFNAFSGFRGALANASGALEQVMGALSDEGKYYVPDGPTAFRGLQSSIEIRNLTFAYPGGREVARDLSFVIKKGEMTALVGPTGAGKTTIVSLLLRFYDCPPDSIIVDGRDIRSYSGASLRAHMAFVSQETLLLHDTLRHNLVYGLENVRDEELRDAIKRARLDDVVERLPQGLDTQIGDRGTKLSGGEKQRVSIARALLKKADILLLDEATSALDSKTESLVQAAIDDASHGKTTLVIAHRLSTIKHADAIVVIEDGRAAEQGTLQELLERNGRFAEYWREQKFAE